MSEAARQSHDFVICAEIDALGVCMPIKRDAYRSINAGDIKSNIDKDVASWIHGAEFNDLLNQVAFLMPENNWIGIGRYTEEKQVRYPHIGIKFKDIQQSYLLSRLMFLLLKKDARKYVLIPNTNYLLLESSDKAIELEKGIEYLISPGDNLCFYKQFHAKGLGKLMNTFSWRFSPSEPEENIARPSIYIT